MSACGGLIKPINGKKPYMEKAIYGFFRVAL